MKEKVTGCMNHSRTSFRLTGDEDKVMFQESQSSTFWFQLVWGLHGSGHNAVNLSPGREFRICKTAQGYGSHSL